MTTLTKRIIKFLPACAASLVLTSTALAQQPANIRFAAAPTDSPWYAYAGALRMVMLKGLPSGSQVEILNTPMAIANTKLLAAQRAEVGMSFSPVVSWAKQGYGPFNAAVENIRGLVGGMDEYFHRTTAQLDGPLQSLDDIKRKRLPLHIGTGPQGSLNEYIARLILQSYDLTYVDIESYGGSIIRTNFNVLRNQYGDKKIDIIMGITSNGHPNTAQLAITPGQRFLGLSEKAVSHLVKYGFAPVTMPANMFANQDYPVVGVGFSTSLYARADMPDEHAYAITKAIMENREALQKQFGSMKNWSAKDSANPHTLAAPLHPGAYKYFKEVGYVN